MEINSMTIVGASSDREKYGYNVLKKALENLTGVYAVNRKGEEISVSLDNSSERRVKSYKTLGDVPEITDTVALYIPRENILTDEVAGAIVERRYKTVLIPPEKGNGDNQDFSEEIERYFSDRNFKGDLLVDVCYLMMK